jgi:hypothetical protein
MIWLDMRNENRSGFMPTPAEWLEWRRHNTVFTDIAAPQPGAATVSGDSEPSMSRPAKRRRISGVLGVKPLIERVFTEEEGLKGVRVAVISHRLWQRRYGGSMPPAFYFMPARDIDIWMPASFPAWMIRNFTWQNGRSWEGFPRKPACGLRASPSPNCTRWRGGFDTVQGMVDTARPPSTKV